MRIGILGGTFDPPHIGHLVTAVNVRHARGLDRVLLVVANEPWQKVGSRPISPAADRLAMVTAAVDGLVGVEASAVEIEHGGPSYTADTLATLRAQFPAAAFTLILGADAAAGLLTWERYAEVQAAADLAVVDRPGSGPVDVPPGFRWTKVEVPALEVSSTEIRTRLATGQPIDFLVPEAVITCLRERRIYRDAS